MSNPGRSSALTARALAEAVLYVSASIAVLFPVLAAPVLADDFVNPFQQFDEAGPGLGSAVSFGWDGATEGASFRIVGNPIGAAFNWLWLSVAAHLGVSMTTFLAVTKYLVFVGCAAAIAWCWRAAGEMCGRAPTMRSAFLWVSLSLFGTVQIHSLWSNDPVASYPLAGNASAALGFLVIGAACRVVSRPTWQRSVTAAVIAAGAVLYYEINIGAVIGGSVVLAAGCWVRWRTDGESVRSSLLATGGFIAVPLSFVLLGRLVTGGRADAYAGTTVRLSGAASTFARGAVSSLPGAGWSLSSDALGGISIVFFVFGTVFLIAWLVRWWTPGRADVAEPPGATTGRLMACSAAVAVATYAAFALALQSITIKVQDEAPRVGYVYTWYAMTSSAVALLLAIGARYIATRPASTVRFVAISLGLSLLLVQNTINWRLSQRLTESYAPNRRLSDSFDPDVDPVERCAALVQWETIAWPEYYRNGVEDGLQEAFEYYFDEPFCPLIGPTD